MLQIAATLILLAVVGSAAALWSDSLKILVTVNTGNVDVEFSPPTTNDPEGNIDPGYDKNVATCYASLDEIENEDDDNPPGNNDLDLNITIVNAYPSYSCTVIFDVTNVGTIPVKGPHIIEVINEFGDGVSWMHNMTEVQIDPGQSVWFEIMFHVEQPADENATYTLQLRLMFHQWNEEPPPS